MLFCVGSFIIYLLYQHLIPGGFVSDTIKTLHFTLIAKSALQKNKTFSFLFLIFLLFLLLLVSQLSLSSDQSNLLIDPIIRCMHQGLIILFKKHFGLIYYIPMMYFKHYELIYTVNKNETSLSNLHL